MARLWPVDVGMLSVSVYGLTLWALGFRVSESNNNQPG